MHNVEGTCPSEVLLDADKQVEGTLLSRGMHASEAELPLKQPIMAYMP